MTDPVVHCQCCSLRTNIDWTQYKTFTSDRYKWVILWENPLAPVLIDESHVYGVPYYNISEVTNGALIFYRDLGVGKKERCVIIKNGQGFQFSFYTNQKQFYYDEWEYEWSETVQSG